MYIDGIGWSIRQHHRQCVLWRNIHCKLSRSYSKLCTYRRGIFIMAPWQGGWHALFPSHWNNLTHLGSFFRRLGNIIFPLYLQLGRCIYLRRSGNTTLVLSQNTVALITNRKREKKPTIKLDGSSAQISLSFNFDTDGFFMSKPSKWSIVSKKNGKCNVWHVHCSSNNWSWLY